MTRQEEQWMEDIWDLVFNEVFQYIDCDTDQCNVNTVQAALIAGYAARAARMAYVKALNYDTDATQQGG